MDTPLTEPDVRREAIRRHLGGEKPRTICDDLKPSPRGFDKGWAEYQHNPWTDFADRARAPKTCPSPTPEGIEQAIVSVRRTREAATTPETRYGLIGSGAIQTPLESLGIDPPRSATIQRILHAQGLTPPMGAGNDSAFYPWLDAWAVNAIHATDIIPKYIRGGEAIENVHPLDHDSHAAYLSQDADKSSVSICEHLIATWNKLGLPLLEPLDNEDAFRGGPTHPRVIGRVARLGWCCGMEVLFTPFYEAERNHPMETFHSLWNQALWSRHEFRDRAHVQAEVPLFEHWYHTVYRPPALQGKTVAHMRRGVPGGALDRRVATFDSAWSSTHPCGTHPFPAKGCNYWRREPVE